MKIAGLILFIYLLGANIFAQGDHIGNGNPFVLGSIVEIQSTKLNENRILNIYLPEGYNAHDTFKYPVIYLLDGSADEDFIHVAGLVQFNSFEWVNRIPKSILVGIANLDRRRDFTYPTSIEKDKKDFPSTGHSDRFISFIEEELQPFMAHNYKVNSVKTLIGESLGGLLATEILLKKPYLFDHYAIISPSLWWDNGSLLKQSFDSLKDIKATIYIGVGKEGLGSGLIPHVMEVDANVLADKLKSSKSKNLKVYFDYLPEETHATIAHQALLNAFKVLYLK